MANAITQLAQVALPGTTATHYTVPANTQTIVKEIILCNTSASAVTVSANFVASGDSADVSNSILAEVSLAAKETKIVSLSCVLDAAATIKAYASTADVIGMTISGVEVS